MAYKGERGKGKLADHWENHLYTVVEKQDNTHTFRIRNCATEQEKVVHGNLIMPVNLSDNLSLKMLALVSVTWLLDDSLLDEDVCRVCYTALL